MRFLLCPVVAAGFLAGCNQGPIQTGAASDPDPYGYLKTSAVCDVTSPKTDTPDAMNVTMKVRSDDGRCIFRISKPGGGAYASFGVSPSPEHGKPLLYNLSSQTVISYTPTLGYSGTDTFGVTLIPGDGSPRKNMTVTATVDATGVTITRPVVVVPVASEKTVSKTTGRRVTRSRRHK
ncbi:hypothetical protein LOC54_04995 [Acetobacter sp. AN02]|uniref:hypothetical protein n=1 Tax=Acetobacter sp. AN02 TaxID=2894186 RepID=UPI0024344E0C|nr:hypothetical protein [Acetobacter sp. AN02]MDG6094475.1 hypothetical protein [Acetobacter sp. AN02]